MDVRAFLPLVVIGAGLYAFHNSLGGPFIFDDLPAIAHNVTIRQLWSLQGITSPPPGLAGRPVVSLSLAANYALGGLHVWGYHAFNLAIHLAASLALYGVVRRSLLSPGLRDRYGAEAPWLALAVALIWAVHPLQTESVTYTIQRTELLMGLFFLLTLYSVIRGAESRRPAGWYTVAVVSAALGMGSKEVMAVVPVAILAYDRLFLSTSLRELFRRRSSLYAGLAATWLVFAALVETRMARDIARFGSSAVSRWDYAKTQAGVLVHYLRLAFWPAPLVADYDDWPLATSIGPIVPWAGLVLTLLATTLWALARRSRLAFLGVWFFLILAPTSSIWPLLSEYAAERRMYLPLAAVIALAVLGGHAALAAVWARLRWPSERRRVAEGVLLVLMVVVLAQMSVRRNEDYRSTEAFWTDVVAKRPHNARGHNNLGEHLFHGGRPDEALSRFAEAVRLKPTYDQAHNNLGILLADEGRLDEAVAQYAEALRVNPAYAEAHNNLGAALTRQGKLEEALPHYIQALRLNRDLAQAHANLGNAFLSQGKLPEAIAHYVEALRINPEDGITHNNLGTALASQGKRAEAIAHYAEALRINPNYAEAHNNLGSEQAEQGQVEDAIAHFSEALRINPAYAEARKNLATALAHRGQSARTSSPARTGFAPRPPGALPEAPK